MGTSFPEDWKLNSAKNLDMAFFGLRDAHRLIQAEADSFRFGGKAQIVGQTHTNYVARVPVTIGKDIIGAFCLNQ